MKTTVGCELTIRCVGKYIPVLLAGFFLTSCFASKSKTEYVLSGVDKNGCAMFQAAGEGAAIAVVIWKSRDGRYNAAYPGKDNCEKANIPKRGPKPVLRKTN